MHKNIKYVLVNCFVNLYIVLLPNSFKEVYKNIENKNWEERENRKGNRTATFGRARPKADVHTYLQSSYIYLFQCEKWNLIIP